MAFAGYFIKINGNLLPQLKGYKLGRYKLYSTADRNLAGDLHADGIGLFPKIFLDFAPTTQSEMASIQALLDQFSFTALYWNEKTGTYKTGTYYAADYDTDILDINRMIYKEFTVNLVPFSKQT